MLIKPTVLLTMEISNTNMFSQLTNILMHQKRNTFKISGVFNPTTLNRELNRGTRA